MTRNGEPLEALALRDAIVTGIEYDAVLPGLVPLYEEREAAVFGHYRWTDWQALAPEERAAAVAHFRLHRLVEMHSSDAVSRAMERRARQQQPR